MSNSDIAAIERFYARERAAWCLRDALMDIRAADERLTSAAASFARTATDAEIALAATVRRRLIDVRAAFEELRVSVEPADHSWSDMKARAAALRTASGDE